MNSRSLNWRRWVRWTLGVVLSLDLLLVLVAWRTAGGDEQAQKVELERLRQYHRRVGADVRRAEEIRQALPDVREDCDRFVREQFLEAAPGYSTVVADLGEIAGRAGLKAANVTFKQRDLANRGVVQVEVTASVEGDYASLVRFINGLERSENFYLLDALNLASGVGGGIKLNLQLRSYFRS